MAALGSDADLVAVGESGEFRGLPVHRGRPEAHRADVTSTHRHSHPFIHMNNLIHADSVQTFLIF